MKKRNRCSTMKKPTGCHGVQDIENVQRFPTEGVLYRNANLPLLDLRSELRNVQDKARSYSVTSVTLRNSEPPSFEQTGSGPNFQGGVLTLCTCKHQMRSRLSVEEWEDHVWIAGFTSRTIYEGKHWLFYLAKVESAHRSHSELWSKLGAGSRNAKAAHLNYLGDIFKPRTPKLSGNAQFSPRRYVRPNKHAHRTEDNPEGWHNDISYWRADESRPAPLLRADPHLTFLWDGPQICFAPKKHCRDYCTWSSIADLFEKLREA